MRQPRLKVPADRPVGYYHCLSRVVDRRFIFGEPEKEHFVKLMREYEVFCEVQVLTHSVMSNHFHILLEVPSRPVLLPDAEAILAKLKNLSGHNGLKRLRQQVEMLRKANDQAAEAQLLARYHDRMWDVSAYMKLVKQRFTQWYNRRNERKGTLWEERFRSVLVEGSGEALLAMAAYIDLNSVRARIVPDPKDYRGAVTGRRWRETSQRGWDCKPLCGRCPEARKPARPGRWSSTGCTCIESATSSGRALDPTAGPSAGPWRTRK